MVEEQEERCMGRQPPLIGPVSMSTELVCKKENSGKNSEFSCI